MKSLSAEAPWLFYIKGFAWLAMSFVAPAYVSNICAFMGGMMIALMLERHPPRWPG